MQNDLRHILKVKLESSSSTAIPMWLKRVRPDILTWIVQTTDDFPAKNIMERVFVIFNGPPPVCSDGNIRKFDTFEKGYRIGCNLGHKCSDVIKNRVENQKITLMNSYGVSNASQLESAKQKTRETNTRKYGTSHHSQNSEIKQKTIQTRKNRTSYQVSSTLEKTRKTNIEKYGADHHMKLKSQQQKVQNANVEKYGVAFPLQNNEIVEAMKNTRKANHTTAEVNRRTQTTLLSKYGVTAPSRIGISNTVLQILDDEYSFKTFIEGKDRKQVVDELGIHPHTLYLYATKYQAADLFLANTTSSFETEIASFLDSLGIQYQSSNRTLIKPRELDFYIPTHNLAIECGGLYWHSEHSAGRDKTYHNEKFTECKKLGIRLLTIFQDEWITKTEQVKQIIMNSLNVVDTRIFARSCSVSVIDTKTAKQFIDENHIQGYAGAKIKLGLFSHDRLVGVMTFGKSRFAKSSEWELVRYCTAGKIIGGASKLFKFFIENYNPMSVISYSDNRWFTGDMYKTLGFSKINETIGYSYTDYKKRYDRHQFQKHKLIAEGFDSSMTEWQIMQFRGFDRIWDCGQTSWEWTHQSTER